MNPTPVKAQISIEDLEKVDIRVGTIEAVADVPASAKLVRLRVNFGDHVRTILVAKGPLEPQTSIGSADLRPTGVNRAAALRALVATGDAAELTDLVDPQHAAAQRALAAFPPRRACALCRIIGAYFFVSD